MGLWCWWWREGAIGLRSGRCGGGGGGKRQIGSYGSAVVAEVEEMIDGGDAADDGCGAGDTW